jgi:hypothetical protein
VISVLNYEVSLIIVALTRLATCLLICSTIRLRSISSLHIVFRGPDPLLMGGYMVVDVVFG